MSPAFLKGLSLFAILCLLASSVLEVVSGDNTWFVHVINVVFIGVNIWNIRRIRAYERSHNG